MKQRQVVMLVDESRFFIDVMRQFLRYSHVKILSLADPQMLPEVVSEKRPDLIFLDRGAPGLEGIQLCARMKSEPGSAEIPLVMLAENGNVRERDLCLKAGCDGLLTKPIDRKAFLAMGRRFLPGIERRQERVLCHVTVFYRTLSQQHYGHTVDISTGGMFIETPVLPAVDERLRLSFNIPGVADMTVDFEARVVWLNRSEKPARISFPTGFGVEFVDPSPRARSLIRQFVEEHSPRQTQIRESQWTQSRPHLPPCGETHRC